MLTIYIDFKSPAAYLALKPTLALSAKHDLELDWRPYRTVERDVPNTKSGETVGESHRRVRAAAQRATHLKYADLQGTSLNFPSVPHETDLALAALATLASHHTEFVEAAFAAYWRDHADLNDEEIVFPLVDNIGAAFSTPERQQMTNALDTALSAADAIGIVGAPAYVIDEQIFIGREHLPWIEGIISAGNPKP